MALLGQDWQDDRESREADAHRVLVRVRAERAVFICDAGKKVFNHPLPLGLIPVQLQLQHPEDRGLGIVRVGIPKIILVLPVCTRREDIALPVNIFFLKSGGQFLIEGGIFALKLVIARPSGHLRHNFREIQPPHRVHEADTCTARREPVPVEEGHVAPLAHVVHVGVHRREILCKQLRISVHPVQVPGNQYAGVVPAAPQVLRGVAHGLRHDWVVGIVIVLCVGVAELRVAVIK